MRRDEPEDAQDITVLISTIQNHSNKGARSSTQQDIFCLFFCGAYHRYLGLINITRYKEIYGAPKVYGRRQTYMPVSHKVMDANSPDVLTPF